MKPVGSMHLNDVWSNKIKNDYILLYGLRNIVVGKHLKKLAASSSLKILLSIFLAFMVYRKSNIRISTISFIQHKIGMEKFHMYTYF